MMEAEKLIEQVANSGETCRCGAYMYANIYKDKIVIICPQCGEHFILHNNQNKTG